MILTDGKREKAGESRDPGRVEYQLALSFGSLSPPIFESNYDAGKKLNRS